MRALSGRGGGDGFLRQSVHYADVLGHVVVSGKDVDHLLCDDPTRQIVIIGMRHYGTIELSLIYG